MSLFNKLFTPKIVSLLLKYSLGINIIVGINTPIVMAAEEVVIYNGVASQSISVEELENFADTGKTSPSLKFLFNFSQQNPQFARYVLNQEFPLEAIWMANVLNTIPGNFFLGEISKRIHPKSKRAGVEALRGSLVQSASEDSRVSLLEVLQNYPTQRVYVDGTVFSQPFKLLYIDF